MKVWEIVIYSLIFIVGAHFYKQIQIRNHCRKETERILAEMHAEHLRKEHRKRVQEMKKKYG